MKDQLASQPANSSVAELDMVIVGGGFGGMYATYRFREMGFKIQCFEAGSDLGGVWFWNRYPGARVDLPSVDYSYSFSREIEQEWTWSEQFAAQPELLRYIDFVAKKLDLRQHYQFNTRVTSANWDEELKRWRIQTDQGATFVAKYCIMATGPLSVPKDPDIPGIGDFKGELYRSGRWPHEPVQFSGKRVGVIGVGSSGIQIVQTVGKEAGELFVFQRTPSFTMPMRNENLDPEYLEEVKRNYAGIREIAMDSHIGGVRPQSTRPFFSVTPKQRKQLLEDAWKNGGLAMLGTFADLLINSEANEHVAEFVRGKIDEVVEDPSTAEKLKPRGYPIFARRPCLDTSYYETFNQPNVHLIDCSESPILEITETGVRTESGVTALDVLIFATGYDGLTGSLSAFEVTGRDGKTVKDKWCDGARSYLGLMLAGFPNLFMTAGPNGPVALANLIRINEHDVDWIAEAIAHAERRSALTVEVSSEAEDRWMELVYQLAKRTLYTKAKTWYVGTNVIGKAQGLSMYTGGFGKYREYCKSVSNDGYAGIDFMTQKDVKHA